MIKNVNKGHGPINVKIQVLLVVYRCL